MFDLLYVEPEQVKGFLIAMTKEGLVGGVYLWINKVNGKMYVGSSNNLYSRISYYLKGTKVHGIIGQALLKYGLDEFVLVLFLFPNATRSLVVALEQSVLDDCTCVYNILPTAGSCAGVTHSDETKEIISDALKGREFSEESKAKMSTAKKGVNHSGEKNPNYNQGLPVHLIQFTPSGLKHVASFPNQTRAAEALGVHKTTIAKRLKNKVTLVPAETELRSGPRELSFTVAATISLLSRCPLI
jgi:group I intron endonuclease